MHVNILTITGGSGAVIGSGTSIQVSQSSGSQSGYLSSTDWSTFNNKLSGTVGIANGGTGQITQQAALNALVGSQTANRVLRSDGTNTTLSQVDLTTDVTGTLPLANGGTGGTTQTTALNSLGIYTGTVVIAVGVGTTAALPFNPTQYNITLTGFGVGPTLRVASKTSNTFTVQSTDGTAGSTLADSTTDSGTVAWIAVKF